MQRAILDTSSIVYAFLNKADIFEAVEDQLGARPILSSGVLNELRMLAGKGKREGVGARVALEIMKKHKVEVIEDDRRVDEWIIEYSSNADYVCTNDIRLKHVLVGKGRQVLSMSEDGRLR